MAYTIRPYRDADAEALAHIIGAAIEKIGPRAYSSQQVAAWFARHPGPDNYRQRVSEGAAILIACDEHDFPVAYALIEPDGHFDHLYCHPDHAGRGLGLRLIEAGEALAQELGLERLFTEASELARPVFVRAGYAQLHRRDFEIAHDGQSVAIHNFAMEKRIR